MATVQVAANTIGVAIPYLSALATTVEGLSRTDPATQQKVAVAMQGVQVGVQALAQSETAAQSQPIVDRIEADGMAVLQAAAGLPLPPPYNIVLMLASSLLPAVIQSVNLLLAHRVTVPAVAPVPVAA
jgi:hypothetical protein